VKHIIVLLFLALATASAASLTPYQLKCEARQNPVGVDSLTPRLSWKLKSDKRGDTQNAYQILVATTRAKLDSRSGDLWDSGRVKSSETIWIPYSGAPLHSFEHVSWKVRVTSGSGDASGWTESEPAEWTMGILDERDRKGVWISPPTYALRSGPMPIFRRELTLDKPVRRALVLVAGLGFHELRINGAKIGNSVLEPAWTNFRATVLYESYDVTSLLKTGPNALALLLGNGFYNVVGGRYSKYTGSFGVPRVWLQLHLEFDSTPAQDIATDDFWRVHDGPITFSDTYGGEDFDARLKPEGWDRPGFDDSRWPKAQHVEAPGGVLKSDGSPPRE
jgi:alpha-L-rhamnosidase